MVTGRVEQSLVASTSKTTAFSEALNDVLWCMMLFAYVEGPHHKGSVPWEALVDFTEKQSEGFIFDPNLCISEYWLTR